MHHEMLDHFAAGRTAVHRFDPAAKTVATLAAILTVSLAGPNHFRPLVPVAAALLVYHAVGRVPVGYVVRHLLLLSPAVAAIALLFPLLQPGEEVASIGVGGWTAPVTAGMVRAADLVSRFVLAAWAALLLMSTTRFQDLLQALARLRVPRMLVTQLAFLYRYLWVMADEAMRLRMARAARDCGGGPWALRLRSRTGIVAVMLLRTWNRSERIYWAMAARGFDGSLQTAAPGRLRAADGLLALGTVAAGAGLIVWDRFFYA
jgi:cobalt/nickel transport system permease protein